MYDTCDPCQLETSFFYYMELFFPYFWYEIYNNNKNIFGMKMFFSIFYALLRKIAQMQNVNGLFCFNRLVAIIVLEVCYCIVSFTLFYADRGEREVLDVGHAFRQYKTVKQLALSCI